MDRVQFKECFGCSDLTVNRWYLHVLTAMDCFEINTPFRQASFVAQIGHESGSLSVIEENLRYSANGLLQIFPKYFEADTAEAYAKKPDKIANRVYGNRMGNGDESSGDGWKYRGRGLIQLTGKESYQACGDALKLDLVTDPDLILEETHASMSAGWEWQTKGCNAQADAGNFEKVTRLINGGLNGYADRLDRWTKAKIVLGV